MKDSGRSAVQKDILQGLNKGGENTRDCRLREKSEAKGRGKQSKATWTSIFRSAKTE